MKTKKPTMGRPSQGHTEAAVLVRGPQNLIDRARESAKRCDLTVSEWWRLAGELMLQVTDKSKGTK